MPTEFAIQQLAKKLRLESYVAPKLTAFFKDIHATIEPVWRRTGRTPTVDVFMGDLVKLLTSHYDRVAKAFHGDSISELQKCLPPDIQFKQDAEDALDEQDGKIDEMLLLIIAARSSTQAGIILNTVQDELNATAESSALETTDSGKPLTHRERGKLIAANFEARIPAKSDLIAVTETQAMAEETKFTEAETVAMTGVTVGGVAIALTLHKVWDSILDEKTREAHVTADGQIRRIGSPFTVGGELLKIPGDTSLGASVANVINCRCSARYTINP